MSTLAQLSLLGGAQQASSNVPADRVVTSSIADDQVISSKIAADAVDSEKIADDAVGIPQLSATGTPSSSNFLRGDNTWTAVTAPSDATITLTAGTGLTGGGSFTTNQSTAETITFNASAAAPSSEIAVGSVIFGRFSGVTNVYYSGSFTFTPTASGNTPNLHFCTLGDQTISGTQALAIQVHGQVTTGTWRALFNQGNNVNFGSRYGLFVRIS